MIFCCAPQACNQKLITSVLWFAIQVKIVFCSDSTYIKIGTIQRRLAWPLRKDDTQIREAFQILVYFFKFFITSCWTSDANI